MQHPPPLPSAVLDAGCEALQQLTQRPPPPQITSAAQAVLYYPLRQVPLTTFIIETLVWKHDVLNVFKGASPEFQELVSVDCGTCVKEVIGYRRVDMYTVLSLVKYGVNYGLFTNEISQTEFELVGLFRTSVPPPNFTSYATFETNYSGDQPSTNNNTNSEDEDAYWDQYGKDEEEEDVNKPNPSLETESSYWDRYDVEQQNVIDEQADEVVKIRPEAVNALASLVPLYRDCGLEDPRLIAEDMLSLTTNSPLTDPRIPPLAHAHAERTWRWVRESPSGERELLNVVNKVKQL